MAEYLCRGLNSLAFEMNVHEGIDQTRENQRTSQQAKRIESHGHKCKRKKPVKA
jgi:hypothetical protein